MRKIVFYGDSNTYGYDPADPYDQRFPREKRWTAIVSERLGGRFQVMPEGMNGRKLPDLTYEQGYLAGLVSKAGTDGIFCTMLGTNDILLTEMPDASPVIRKMEKYVDYLKIKMDPHQILIIAPPLIGSGKPTDPLLERYHNESRKMNDAFRVITKEQGVMFADSSKWGIELAYDQVHFSEEGHRVFAGKVTDLIIDVCEGER